MGHVASDSRTGTFQSNAADNRVYQMIRGWIVAGVAPRARDRSWRSRTWTRSPPASPRLRFRQSRRPGVYHVESPYEVDHETLIGWLNRLGYHIEVTGQSVHADHAGTCSKAEQVAKSWAEMQDRGVTIERTMTLAALGRLGIEFERPTLEWWAASIQWAARAGLFAPPSLGWSFPELVDPVDFGAACKAEEERP